MGSDHIPIVVTISARPDRELAALPRWKCSKADWSTFRQLTEQRLNGFNINEDVDIDQLNDNVVNIIRTAAENSVLQIKPLPPRD